MERFWVDVGAGAATIAVFEQGNLVATSTIQIGGEYISNDIAIGLRTQLEIAEKIKLKYGCASVDDSAPDQVFKVTRMGSNVEKEFSQVDLANIIEPRVEEIFQMIRAEVHRLGYGDLAGGYVLTGGTVCMPGILAVAQAELATSVRIAVPDFIGVRDPSYTSGVGIIQFVSKYMKNRNSGFSKKVVTKSTAKKSSDSNKPGFLERVKNFFSEFI
ncbi:cell division protein FtsA [Paenibacillus sp. V4I3]|nr:cell division protein FtsA [Paenibacillus sp. V4I3]